MFEARSRIEFVSCSSLCSENNNEREVLGEEQLTCMGAMGGLGLQSEGGQTNNNNYPTTL